MKREKFLWPLTGEHHEALMMCRTIRQAAETIQGDGAGSPLENLSAKVSQFFIEKLKPHFAAEERMAETLSARAEKNEDLLLRLSGDHKRLKNLAKNGSLEALVLFAEELEAHVRFEENIYFPLLESGLTEKEKQKAGEDLKQSLFSCSSQSLEQKKEEVK
jgi:hemerythrin-like domain-containing protein